MAIDIIIPTLNAEGSLALLLQSLAGQTMKGGVLVIDSTSDDRTAEIAREHGCRVATVSRNAFDHGCTRNEALRLCSSEIAVFLTQDAVPADQRSIENLIRAFEDDRVAAAYGRQLPRPAAGPVEAHARLFNYPPEGHVRSLADAPRLGIKAAFTSNSFAAYRRQALDAAGSFPCPAIISEDMAAAARMLLADWKIAYCGDAQVYHSHPYGPLQEFRRYFDIGVFHAQEPWIRERFGQAEGEGMKFVRSEIRYLREKAPWLIPQAVLRTCSKYLGYRLGGVGRILPLPVKRACSMNTGYWKKLR